MLLFGVMLSLESCIVTPLANSLKTLTSSCLEKAMSSVVVSMLVLEGLGRSLDPDLNLMKAAVPYLLVRKV